MDARSISEAYFDSDFTEKEILTRKTFSVNTTRILHPGSEKPSWVPLYNARQGKYFLFQHFKERFFLILLVPQTAVLTFYSKLLFVGRYLYKNVDVK